MKRHGFIEILDQKECEETIVSVNSLHSYWERDVPAPLNSYTLGAVTYHIAYSDLNKSRYFKNQQLLNPIFNEKFGWIYQKCLSRLSKFIGPCELINSLGHPGFHIFGHPPGEKNNMMDLRFMKEPLAKIHQDIPYVHHMNTWKQFSEVDLENTLSFTLTLEAPSNGAGLLFWEDETLQQYETPNEYSKYVKSVSIRSNPSVIQYKVGSLFFFMGNSLWHQIAPAYNLNETDRRITMQAHGVLCDGVWKIYF